MAAEWARYAETASAVITDTQRQAVAAATAEAHALTPAALDDAGVSLAADVARLHPSAMRDLVGVLGDGSPLKTLLDALGVQAAQEVGDALKHAIAVGRNPRQTVRDIRSALGSSLNRALTIARTEQMRAYRGASLRSYQANADILRGWQWRASPSRRTCPVCLAMDGSEHPLEELTTAQGGVSGQGTGFVRPGRVGDVRSNPCRWVETTMGTQQLRGAMQHVLAETAFQVEAAAKTNAPVDTGFLRNSIHTILPSQAGADAAEELRDGCRYTAAATREAQGHEALVCAPPPMRVCGIRTLSATLWVKICRSGEEAGGRGRNG